MINCEWDSDEQTSIRFHLNLNILHIMKLIWKCRPQQGGYFTSGSMFIHTHYGIESVSWLDYNFKYMTKWQFLWGFVKNITLAKDLEEKYSYGLRIFVKNTPLARNLGPKCEPRPLPEKIAVVNSGSPSHQVECRMKVSWKNIGSDIMTSHSIRTILYLNRLQTKWIQLKP